MLVGRYSAFLDASVLDADFLRSSLLWFADARLLRPVWSKDVFDEWRAAVQLRRPHLSDRDLDKLQAYLPQMFPDAEVSNYKQFASDVELTSPGECHVLAAAIVGRCNGIITTNLAAFPGEQLKGFGIEVVHPDEFIVNVIDLDQDKALGACKRHREAMFSSSPNVEQFLERYERAGLIQAYQRLCKHKELL